MSVLHFQPRPASFIKYSKAYALGGDEEWYGKFTDALDRVGAEDVDDTVLAELIRDNAGGTRDIKKLQKLREHILGHFAGEMVVMRNDPFVQKFQGLRWNENNLLELLPDEYKALRARFSLALQAFVSVWTEIAPQTNKSEQKIADSVKFLEAKQMSGHSPGGCAKVTTSTTTTSFAWLSLFTFDGFYSHLPLATPANHRPGSMTELFTPSLQHEECLMDCMKKGEDDGLLIRRLSVMPFSMKPQGRNFKVKPLLSMITGHSCYGGNKAANSSVIMEDLDVNVVASSWINVNNTLVVLNQWKAFLSKDDSVQQPGCWESVFCNSVDLRSCDALCQFVMMYQLPPDLVQWEGKQKSKRKLRGGVDGYAKVKILHSHTSSHIRQNYSSFPFSQLQ